MIQFGNNVIGIFVYSKQSKGAVRKKFFMSRHMYFAPLVLRTLFHMSLDVVRSPVHIESLPG